MDLKIIFQTFTLLLSFNIFVCISYNDTVPEDLHTCIIGSGYSGLAAARYLKEYGVNFTVFERSKAVGGTWRFDPHIGVDEDGVPVSTSQYKYLRTNSPRHTMEYHGFSFPKSAPSFPLGTCFYKYLKSFVKYYDLMSNIQLRSFVTSVKRLNNQWELSYYKTDNRENYIVFCDFVIVAIGQYNRPNIPKFAGLESFEGKVIHSHDYKSPEPYKGRKVLLVGAGPSGLDLAVQLHKITEKLVHSHHFIYNEPKFSEKYVKKPDITKFVNNGVFFNDSSFEQVDDVILATGFKRDYPFLDESSGLTYTSKFLLPLYNQIVNIRQPTMLFIGVVNHFMNRFVDLQAEYIASLLSGQFELPTEQNMLEEWLTKYSPRKLSDIHSIKSEEGKYAQKLIKEAGINKVPPVLFDLLHFSNNNILNDILHYRDYDYEIIDSNQFKSQFIYNNTEERISACPFGDEHL